MFCFCAAFTCRHDSIISGSDAAVALSSGEHWRRMRGITISSCEKTRKKGDVS
jgi:hypothetical protein